MKSSINKLTQEVIDEGTVMFPRTWTQVKKLIHQGMALECEECARDEEEISPDAASVIRSRKVKDESRAVEQSGSITGSAAGTEKCSMKEIEAKVGEYLATLDDYDEKYPTDRRMAKIGLDGFLEWLNNEK